MKYQGFSLIELLIAIAVVGIISTIAYPSYQEHVERSRRADVINNIHAYRNDLERAYTTTNNYIMARDNTVPPDLGDFYNINMVVTGATYTLTVTPQGIQTNDEDCASLSINQAGIATSLDKLNNDSSATCWSR